MSSSPDVALIQGLRESARPLSDADPHDALIEAIGDARLVLLGEASHGTHDFYAERARLTQRLIFEKGFHAVAVEADWPDAYRVNRFVRRLGEDQDADTALSGFKRFPVWMWRNTDVLDFVRWLRSYDDSLPTGAPRVGFYGLDLYSLHASIDEVLRYLGKVDPEAARLARERYRCFDDFGGSVEEYARSAALGVVRSCEDAVVKQLVELLQQRSARDTAGNADAEEEWFQAVQNAQVVKNAEEYYRTMYRGASSPGTCATAHGRDHRAAAAPPRSQRRTQQARGLEHNSHLGDARATELGQRGELNVGQLVRERHGATPSCSDSPPTPARSPRPPSGVGRRSGNASGARSPEATSRSSTGWESLASSSICATSGRRRAGFGSRASSAPSACCICRPANGGATTSGHCSPGSSTR